LTDLTLSEPLNERIKKILQEYRQRAKLLAHGLNPRRKALLAGPPGTGKTMTARVLAGELNLPLYTVLMDKLVTKYMGETSAKLRQIFSCMPEQKGIYLFDEFDAIGGDRTRDNDVGEMRRVLNAFLQLLEEDGSESLIIAATNEANILDSALFRRFDDVLRYENPDEDSIRELLRNKLGSFGQPFQTGDILIESALGLSHAEIAQACSDAIKDAVLHDMSTAPVEYVTTSLSARKAKYLQVGQ
jgi:SpoVK/Ycf46/Vps4 family AAA+-type ATPase